MASTQAKAPASRQAAQSLPGFEHFKRLWLASHQRFSVKVKPGEYYVTCQDEMITTVLGSCIAACIYDPVIGIGGMNHFMLPDSDSGLLSASNRYGVFAMEQLLNELYRYGSQRERLQIKIVGGGKMLEGVNDIGQQNIEFVRQFLATEGLRVAAEDIGGIQARKVMYQVRSGRMFVKKMNSLHNSRLQQIESSYHQSVGREQDNDVELF